MEQVRSYILSIALFLSSVTLCSAQLYINEFQAANGSSCIDPDFNEFSDWIELYNEGNLEINLNGYYLTDNINDLQKWQFPYHSIGSHDFLVIWADKSGIGLHTNFKLDSDGESIYLVSPNGNIIDSVNYSEQYPDISQGRYPDGGGWFLFETPTPGMVNPLVHFDLSSKPLGSVEYDPSPGFYSGEIQVSLSHIDTTTRIFYTLNGSEPDTTDLLYSAPIKINTTSVVRAKAFRAGCLPGIDKSATYFIDDNFGLPVVSLSFDSCYFWDRDMGIYIDENKSVDYSWERPVNMELFDPRNPYISMGAGVNLFGAITRFVPMPSLAVHARQKYGTKSVKSKLFEDKDIQKFKSFILRNSGSDWEETLFNDALMQSLIKDRMDIDYQEYQPAIVFFNGLYWGIHNIREKINEDYLEANHGVNPDSVDIIFRDHVVIEGSTQNFHDLYNFIRFNSPSDSANYEVIKTWMDISEYMNYYIAQIYFFNQDWPMNNCKFWREQKEGSKWRWLLYDLDFGFGATKRTDNMVEWATDPGIDQNYIFIRLLKNTEFRNEFLQRFRAHMNTSFQPERVIALIDSFQERLRPNMDRHIERWGEPTSISYWEQKVESMRKFANQRLPELKNNLNSKFYISSENVLSVTTVSPGMGKVFICEVEIPDTFSGTFYANIPIRIEAKPANGFRFTGWTGSITGTSETIYVNLSADSNLEAHFEPISPLNGIYINEVLTKNTRGLQDEYLEREDWIELYNAGKDTINLAGLMISDKRDDLDKYRISGYSHNQIILLPGERLVLFADEDPQQGVYHLDFKLSSNGETVYLSQLFGLDTLIIDSLRFTSQFANVSYGRMPDGSGDLVYMKPTPDSRNEYYQRIPGIVINEFSADNTDLFSDTQGNFSDWIELHNTNSFPVNIGGMFLTDSLENPFKYRITDEHPDSTTIMAGGYMIFWADNQSGDCLFHTNFKLSRQGEQIGLALPDASAYVDSIYFVKQYRNSSYSRFPNAGVKWNVIPSTPQAENIYHPVQGLIINEFSADNQNILDDGKGQYSDWIEIFNTNSYAVNIGGLYLTDSLGELTKHRIPTTEWDSTLIEALGYLVLYADNQPEEGVRHLNFKLSRGGELIGLAGHMGEILDRVYFTEQFQNSSLSRYPNASSTWKAIPCSPGNINEFIPLDKIFINEFSADNSQFTDEFGEYDDWIELYNANNFDVDLAGYYLTDRLSQSDKSRISSNASDLTVVPAKGYLLFWADGNTEQGIRHLDFRLSANGEEIGLINPDLSILDSLTFGLQLSNSGLSRYPDGSDTLIPLPLTPNYPNLIPDYSNIFINELVAVNGGEVVDEYGESDDWIELFNSNPYPVNIGGLYFTDDKNNLKKHRIPTDMPDHTTLAPYQYYLFWADGSEDQGPVHLNFKLSQEGEWIALSSEFTFEPEIIDSVSFGIMNTFQSYGRNLQQPDRWQYFKISTPEEANKVLTDETPELNDGITINFYPNPFRNELYCILNRPISGNLSVELYNLQGIKVKTLISEYPKQTEVSWNTSDLPGGIYIAVVHVGEVQKYIRLVCE